MSAIHATVSSVLSHVSVTARMSILLESSKSQSEAVLPRIDQMFVVANLTL